MDLAKLLELGTAIREAREKAGLSLDDVAARIKVSTKLLSAIEKGSAEGLPHAVYTRGFARSYGLEVGLDAETLNPLLEDVFTPDLMVNVSHELSATAREQAMNPGHSPAVLLVVVLLVVLLGGLGWGGWYVFDNYGSQIWEFVQKPFSANADAVGQSTSASTPGTLPGGAASGEGAGAASGSGSAGSASSAASGPASAGPASSGSVSGGSASSGSSGGADAATSATNPAAAATPGTTPDSSSANTGAATGSQAASPHPAAEEHVLVLTAKSNQNCWMDFTVDGVKPGDFTLRQGNTHKVQFKKSLTVVLGNAGGVTLEYNGVPYPVSGGKVTLNFPPQD